MNKNNKSPNTPDPRKGQQNKDNSNDLLSGIRRVSADQNVRPVEHSQRPATQNSHSASSDPHHAAKKTMPASGKPMSGARNAVENKPGQGVRRVHVKQSKEEIKRRKRNAAILLGSVFLVILIGLGTGIFFLVKHFTAGGKESSVSMTVSETTSLATSESVSETTSEITTTTEMTTTTESTAEPTPATTPFPVGGPDLHGYCVVIDAGHQEVANLSQEAMSDGMSGSKAKSSEGFTGVISGINESEINLSVELLLKAYLESLGCEVYVTRETNDVDISNKERAQFAVSHDPDLYIRLFCNAANDSAANGCEVIVPSGGKYASEVGNWGEMLGKSINGTAGCAFNGCKKSGNYSGLNWASDIPAFMLRMGYLSNSDEETLLLSEEYQFKICQGIAQFINTMPKR